MSPSKRRAQVKGRSGPELSHLDLENFVVALFTERSHAWPNALFRLGYRLHHFDAAIDLIELGGKRRDVRPDAIGHHSGRNIALVIECKTGTEVGLHQIPEGRTESADQWAEGISIPRGRLPAPQVRGLLVAESAQLEPRLPEIVSAKASWLRVEDGFRVDPNHLPDNRIGPAVEDLPHRPWPRSYVPFSHDTSSPEDLERVIAAIGPLILQAAYRGQVFVEAETLARKTHEVVWDVSDKNRHTSWTGAVAKALESLVAGKLREYAAYDKTLKRIRFIGIREGIGADARTLAALKRAISEGHRRLQRRGKRVATSAPSALQITLFQEDELL